MTWIQTYTGVKFDLEQPTPQMVNISDIAHALSQICRFTGHVPEHYSVAQHSVLVSEQAKPQYAFESLMHDAAEAYVGDMAAPLKRAMRKISSMDKRTNPYDVIESIVWRAIAEKFGLPFKLSPAVKVADLRMLMAEKKMLGKAPQDWDVHAQPYDIEIEPWSAVHAEWRFLRRFDKLSRRA